MSQNIDYWTGVDGDAYHDRNPITEHGIKARMRMWQKILHLLSCNMGVWGESYSKPMKILEAGAGLGENLVALRALESPAWAFELFATEPNIKAAAELCKVVKLDAAHFLSGEMQQNAYDLVFTSGVLIHVPSHLLLPAIKSLHAASRRYILCIEYFSDKEEAVTYHNRNDVLWKRDYGSIWMKCFPGLKLLGYDFEWKRATSLDNLTWHVFEKS
jgi:hypothetical protein